MVIGVKETPDIAFLDDGVRRVSVFFDDVDVSLECFRAKDGPDGWIDIFSRNFNGERFMAVDKDGKESVHTQRRHGSVRFEFSERGQQVIGEIEKRNCELMGV